MDDYYYNYSSSREQDNDGYGPKKKSESERAIDPNQVMVDSIMKFPRISPEETDELARCMHEAKKACKYKKANHIRNEIVSRNLRLVYSLAVKYAAKFGKEVSDLVSVGSVAMMRAAKNYNPDNPTGANFGTFAVYYLKGYMSRYVTLDNIIKKPAYYIEDYRKIKKVLAASKGTDSRIMFEEAAKLTGYSLKEIEDILDVYPQSNKVALLVEAHHDRIDVGIEGPVKKAIRNERGEIIQKVIRENLRPFEWDVLRYRFGANDYHVNLSLRKLAKILKTSPEEVRLIELRALKKLREKPKARKILEGLVA